MSVMNHPMQSSTLFYIFSFPSFLSDSSSTRAFPYDQPSATELLVLLSFLFFLNVLREVADYVLCGGIIAEIFLGMVYGAPLAGILPAAWEDTFTILGYLGLIGLVFEGGLATNLPLLLSNLTLSALCAATGVALPVALSFALLGAGYGYSNLETFAAGAALSSTSLGTTLMALNSVSRGIVKADSNIRTENQDQKERKTEAERTSITPLDTKSTPLQHTRIGTVLVSAAVIDDVIGLVLSSIIPALSALRDKESELSTTTNIAWTIIRPLLSSALIAMITPLVARFILRPLFWWRGIGERWCAPARTGKPWGSNSRWLLHIGSHSQSGASWGIQLHADAVKLTIMILFVSAFSSICYYTGSSVLFGAYLAGLTLSYISRPPARSASCGEQTRDCDSTELEVSDVSRTTALSFEEAYGRTIGPLQSHILAPLFFASIGYAIPFIPLWKPAIFWRGVLYALLMAISKIAVCLPIILWTVVPGPKLKRLLRFFVSRSSQRNGDHPSAHTTVSTDGGVEETQFSDPPGTRCQLRSARWAVAPAAFMGVAMVSRGEIGLLIAQVARSAGSQDSEDGGLLGDEAFLVCTWAILLCTLIGPIGVGFIVRRWESSIRRGIWG